MRSINEIFRELKAGYQDLNTYQLLDLATKMQCNEILKEGLMVYNNTPTALEAIAMQLGMKPEGVIRNDAGTILGALSDIEERLGEIKTRIEEK